MAKLGGWLGSFLIHAAPMAAIAYFGAVLRTEGPVVSISVPPSVPLSVEVQKTDPAPAFEVPPDPSRPLEVTEVPFDVDLERDTVAVEDEAAPLRILPEPPRFDRPVTESVAVQKVVSVESVPEVLTETVATEVYNPPPEYPSVARRKRIEGSVLVEVTILADGTCGGVRVLEDAEHDSFGKAALESVKRWKFQPATRGGKPVESTQKIRFTFKLQG